MNPGLTHTIDIPADLREQIARAAALRADVETKDGDPAATEVSDADLDAVSDDALADDLTFLDGDDPEAKGSRASLDRSPRSNWVEESGELPGYVREVARSISQKRGVPLSRAIAIAIGVMKNWAAGKGDVTAATRAKAAAAVAQWEALKAKNRARMAGKKDDEPDDVETKDVHTGSAPGRSTGFGSKRSGERSGGERDRMADDGEALPEGGFPIGNREELRKAIQALGRAKNQAAAKRHIIRRARALDALDLLPDSWNVTKDGEPEDVETKADEPDGGAEPEDVETKDVIAGIEHKAVPVGDLVDVDEEQGIVTAIVSVTGVVDRVKDVIEPGAYAKTLAARTPKGVWSHDWEQPISKTLECVELMPGDPRLPKTTRDGSPWPREAGALLVKTQFNLLGERGRQAFADVKFFGPDQEWSIGYHVPPGESKIEGRSGVRHIRTLDLYEYSPVLFGAMPSSSTLSVKSAQQGYAAMAAIEAGEIERAAALMSDAAVETKATWNELLHPRGPGGKFSESDKQKAAEKQKADAEKTKGTVYKVKAGDTLWKIAERHYGDGSRWKEIAEANGVANEDPRKMPVGIELTVPGPLKGEAGKGGGSGSGGDNPRSESRRDDNKGSAPLEEDEIPEESPSGAKVVDFDGKKQRAVYGDGAIYTAEGWSKGKASESAVAALRRKRTASRAEGGQRALDEDVQKAPAKSPSGAKRTETFEDGSAVYADGLTWDPEEGRFRKRRGTKAAAPVETKAAAPVETKAAAPVETKAWGACPNCGSSDRDEFADGSARCAECGASLPEVKAGRVLSAANGAQIRAAYDALGALLRRAGLLDTTDPEPTEEKGEPEAEVETKADAAERGLFDDVDEAVAWRPEAPADDDQPETKALPLSEAEVLRARRLILDMRG